MATIPRLNLKTKWWHSFSFIIPCLFLLVGLMACSAVELEPSLSGTIPVSRQARPTRTLPGLQPRPSDTPMPALRPTDTGESDLITPTAPSPPTDASQPIVSTTETETPAPDGGLPITPTPWDVPSRWPTLTPVPPPAGLIYENDQGLWRVGENWQPELLADIERGSILSPDGRRVLFYEDDDIWLLDLEGSEQRNLTANRDRTHCCARWWPARPDTIIFGSWPSAGDRGPSDGYLSAININDGSYQVLDEQSESNALAAPGPGGQIIAYDRAGSAWLYHWLEGPEPLDLDSFGLENIVRIGGPAWSPDGQLLAWTAAVANQGVDPWLIALVVLDPNSGTGQFLHPYQNMGRGGWFPPPAWSPDGQWIAFVAEDVDLDLNGLWVVKVDGSSEYYLGPGGHPIFSPDNHWLAFTAYLPEQGYAEETRLAELPSWYTIRMDLPPGSIIREWR